MTAYLPLVRLRAGNIWTIPGLLVDAAGLPLNLNGKTIEWFLKDANNVKILGPGDYTLEIIDAASGSFAVHVQHPKTETVPPGSYKHFLEVTISGAYDTYWQGPIKVLPPVE